jgi:hypothetical protein
MKIFIALSLAIFIFPACEMTGVRALDESTTETISPLGGMTKSADGLLTISFPAGAVANPTDVTIETDRSRNEQRLVSPVYRVLPRGLAFDAPIEIDFDVSGFGGEELAAAIVGGSGRVPFRDCTSAAQHIRCTGINDQRTELAVVSIAPPVPVTGDLPRLEAGGYWTCAHLADETLKCWGGIWLDQRPDQAPVPTGKFAKLYGGLYHHTCAMRGNGEIDCFGQSMFNQTPPAGSTFIAFTAGGFHNCGVYSDGRVECWGHADYGQLLVPGGTFTDVSGGITHTCGLREDGTATCWGSITSAPSGTFTKLDSGDGTCGQRPDGSIECWNAYAGTPSGAFADFSVGTGHACGVRADNSGECWGSDTDALLIPPGHAWLQLSAGFGFTCGLTTTHEVYCWGRNDFGQAEPPASL